MKLTKRLRHYWHELYYSLVSEGGIHFAMNCKDVTEKIDLAEAPLGPWGRFRFWLHLSLCQACKDYFDLSNVLKRGLRKFMKSSDSQVDLDRLNKNLLQKHSKN